MKIIHLSNTPLSNAPANLMQCQNQYGHDAKLYLQRKSNLNKVFVGGKLWMDVRYENLRQEFKDADVFHFHNYAWDLILFKTFPELVDICRKKPCIIQYHSPRRTIENFEHSIADKSLKHAVIAQYHVREYPECEFVVPNVVPIFDKKYQGAATKWEDPLPTVSFAPSNITMRGWDDKGHYVVDPILRRLEGEGKIMRDVMIGVPYEDCMLRKSWSHIGIDEVMTGSYHLSALEYMSMGCLTIVGVDDLTKAAINMVSPGAAFHMPFIGAAAITIEGKLRWVLEQGMPFIKDYGAKSRQWMEKFWNPENHVRLFEKVYQSL